MKTVIKNIAELIQTEDTPRKWVAGEDMKNINNVFQTIKGSRTANWKASHHSLNLQSGASGKCFNLFNDSICILLR